MYSSLHLGVTNVHESREYYIGDDHAMHACEMLLCNYGFLDLQ